MPLLQQLVHPRPKGRREPILRLKVELVPFLVRRPAEVKLLRPTVIYPRT